VRRSTGTNRVIGGGGKKTALDAGESDLRGRGVYTHGLFRATEQIYLGKKIRII